MRGPVHIQLATDDPVDVVATLRPALRAPSGGVRDGAVWRATLTPLGPATTRVVGLPSAIVVDAWGPGARWVGDHAAELAGASDDTRGFAPGLHPAVDALHRQSPGVRVPRTLAVFEALLAAILEQRVQTIQARRAYRGLVTRYGQRAPGPGAALGLRVPPGPATVARIPTWVFHRLNVERTRAVTLQTAARFATRLEETTRLAPLEASARLQTLPGIGPWTAAEVAVVALGDADAVRTGDFHLPNTIAFALAREARGDDARMLDLLEPWRRHRARVVKLIEGAGIFAPRRGPRLALQDVSAW